MSADALLSRLSGVKRTGPGRHIAKCPAHADRTASLSIRELDDGRLLLHDFAGCSVHEVLGAVGMDMSDLFPPREIQHAKGERKPFFPSDVFEVARLEIGVVAVIASDLHKNRSASEDDYQRLYVAIERLNDIAGAAYGR